jgi:hypothetical protein
MMKSRSRYAVVLCTVFLVVQMLLLGAGAAWAQSTGPARESAVKAAFLYRFAGFVEWPASTFQRPDQPLVIGVAGDDEVAADLDQILGERFIDGRPVVARRLAEGAPVSGVHILFLANRRESRLRELIAAASGPVLVVTAAPDALALGSVINFSAEAGRVRFSASLASADARNLKLSARLLEVAQTVEGRR